MHTRTDRLRPHRREIVAPSEPRLNHVPTGHKLSVPRYGSDSLRRFNHDRIVSFGDVAWNARDRTILDRTFSISYKEARNRSPPLDAEQDAFADPPASASLRDGRILSYGTRTSSFRSNASRKSRSIPSGHISTIKMSCWSRETFAWIETLPGWMVIPRNHHDKEGGSRIASAFRRAKERVFHLSSRKDLRFRSFVSACKRKDDIQSKLARRRLHLDFPNGIHAGNLDPSETPRVRAFDLGPSGPFVGHSDPSRGTIPYVRSVRKG